MMVGTGWRRGEGGAVLALVVIALNLRGPVTAVSPILGEIRADLAIDPVTAGLLTSIPVLCFGLLTPLASALIGRIGVTAAMFVTLAGAGLGEGLRAGGGLGWVLAGTLVIGAGLTIGNIVSLLVIARDFPGRTRAVTGVYTSALNVGTMLTSALTAPLAVVWGWRGALAAWSGLAVLAALLWGWSVAHPPATAARPAPAPPHPPAAARGPVWRRPLARLLVVAFTAHLLIYYGLTAWLPLFLQQAAGMSPTEAGLAASAFQILALLGSFGAPALTRWIALPPLLVAIAVAWALVPPLLVALPSFWPLAAIIGGFATGGGFTVTFMLIQEHSASLDDNRRLSSLVQGLGYAIAAAGPLVIGAVHQASASWSAAFLLLDLAALAMALAGGTILRLRLR